ncbi:PLP-dependent transferase [Xylariaceae sp. FL0594]|nr:PLP-dependent transferase [Xylariaceae sp. FL0594]
MKPTTKGGVGVSGLETTLFSRLTQRASQQRLRQLVIPRPDLVDFSSNDYLSLSENPSLRRALIAQLQLASPNPNSTSSHNPHHENKSESKTLSKGKNNNKNNPRLIGSGGSRLLDGNSSFVESLERKISSYHRSGACLLFNSAYDANVGLMSCVPGRDDVILYDALIHASVHDGMRLSRARRQIAFSHASIINNNTTTPTNENADEKKKMSGEVRRFKETLQDLVRTTPRIASGESNVFICLEALYSMDGDIADLRHVTDVVDALLPNGNGYVIVDEAHSVGVLGQGRGLVSQLGLEDRVWARVLGFGKAMGCAGGAILCTPTTRLYLINYARTLIYTTAMSFPSLASINAAYDYMIDGKARPAQLRLHRLIQHCHAKLRGLRDRFAPTAAELALPPHTHALLSSSPIIPLFTSHPRSLARHCQSSGFMIRAIVAPTVPRGQERVRICIHAANTTEQIDDLCEVVGAWLCSLRAEWNDSDTGGGGGGGGSLPDKPLEANLYNLGENMKPKL